MKERPILFSAPMVRAILAGAKTQTRRVVKWRHLDTGLNLGFSGLRASAEGRGWVLDSPSRTSSEWRCDPTPCPYGQPADRLWVRESIKALRNERGQIRGYVFSSDDAPIPRCPDLLPQYADQMAFAHLARAGGVPSIHMPRWASRITLEITGVRVERLQAISFADALAEGIVQRKDGGFGLPAGEHYHCADPRQSYFSLWEAINGPGSVQENPWVWAVDFKRVEAP